MTEPEGVHVRATASIPLDSDLSSALDDIRKAQNIERAKASIEGFSVKLAEPETVRIARTGYELGNLTLVLGAGVSRPMKIPLWKNLVHSLFNETYLAIAPHMGIDISNFSDKFNNLILVRHLESIIRYESDLVLMLRDKLYELFDESGTAEIISPICEAFLLNSVPRRVSRVLTYNFDNALERDLLRLGQDDFLSVFSEKTYRTRGGSLTIFHPHGFLPHCEDDPAGIISIESATVFSERSYNEQFALTWNWQNLVQLNEFMTRTCLFIGMSMSDPNIRRLLDHAARHIPPSPLRHVSIQRSSGISWLDNFTEMDLASLGVATLWISDFDQIPSLVIEIAKA